MKPDEAAMTGALVANTARKAGELEYQAIAYGDEKTGIFKWNY